MEVGGVDAVPVCEDYEFEVLAVEAVMEVFVDGEGEAVDARELGEVPRYDVDAVGGDFGIKLVVGCEDVDAVVFTVEVDIVFVAESGVVGGGAVWAVGGCTGYEGARCGCCAVGEDGEVEIESYACLRLGSGRVGRGCGFIGG